MQTALREYLTQFDEGMMAESKDPTQSHLQADKDPLWWDWWSENPIEIVLVIFVLVLFFAFPRQGCGITDNPPAPPTHSTPASP